MIELLTSLPAWQRTSRGAPCAVATVVSATGSVPRPVGTSMLVARCLAPDGAADGAPRILGSLSGGCVEGAVVAAALDVLDGGGARIERFGYSAEDAFAAGLTCGGELEVHIARLGSTVPDAADPAGTPAGCAPEEATAVVRRLDSIDSIDPNGSTHDAGTHLVLLGAPTAGEALAAALAPLFPGEPAMAARAAVLVAPVLAQGMTGVVVVGPEGGCAGPDLAGARPDQGVRLLVESRLPAPRFIVIGANDFGAALVPAAKLLGYRVTLVDARAAFTAQARFACADEVVTAWPHEYLAAEAEAGRLDARTAVAVLSHDPKFDVPLLDLALGLDLAYLGAMGSRRSHEQRIAALLEAGHGPVDLGRLRSPIGLDLGATTPAEVAVSILAEVVATRHPGASGRPLRDREGRIHAEPTGGDLREVTPRRGGVARPTRSSQSRPREAPAWT
ncbi:hypothetical protein SCMU_33610 [Sinomonas cyclohexanicum]|uniref:Xanthine dehydrogenase accessory factor n=1 Tax=Sinomonas cyclohexanicum TaxID=322009 RepID=A0ABM7PYZ0_SINCY|nr:XdhC/CoxI family protein [Corynebacterium cyclohexanicum]BCT77519.1 hypothetical protein SCMU_33610 [Corynebacterium cyclohexanicum]